MVKGQIRTCLGCRRDLPLTQFKMRGSKRNPHSKSPRCHGCRSRYEQNSHFLKKYGITYDDYLEMYEDQGGACFLCDQTGPLLLENGRRRLHVDHSHKSGVTRGLLCNRCNWRLGLMETTSKAWFKRAKRYIKQFELDLDDLD